MFTKVPSKGPHKHNLIILHDLLGDWTNFRRFSKTATLNANADIYLLDLRNQGSSQHMPTMTMKEMSDDIVNFMDVNSLESSYILGHGLGGNIAMEFCQNNPERANGQAIVDIAPRVYTKDVTSKDTFSMIKQLNELEQGEQILGNSYGIIRRRVEEIVQNKANAEFFLTNLTKGDNGQYKWRANMESIIDYFQHIVYDWVPDEGLEYTKPTRVVVGTKSKYVDPVDMKVWQKYFPKLNLDKDFHYIDAGHSVQLDKPEEFVESLKNFIPE